MARRAYPLLVVAALLALGAAGCGKDPEVAKREYVQSGDKYFDEGKFSEAIIEYRNAVQQDPRFGEARSKLAESFLQAGDLVNAYQQYVRAADLLPDDAQTQLKAGELLLLAREFEQAESRADKALAIDATLVEAQILRANALAGLDRLEDAIAEVEQAIENDPMRIGSYASLGSMRLLEGDRQQAEAAFRKAVGLNPDSSLAHLALGNFFWATGRQPDAEAELKAALALEPENLVANRALALFYQSSRRAAEAEPYLKVIADQSPDASGKLALADYYAGTQRVAEARRILEEVAAQDEAAYGNATLKIAALGLRTGDSEKANALVEEVLAKEPENAEALLAKAQLRATAGDLDVALAAAQAAVSAQPQAARAHMVLGRIRTLRHENTEAVAAYTEALSLNPRMATAEVALARLNLAAGRIDDAKILAQSAVSKVSGYIDAQLLLAQLNLLQGNVQAAEPPLRILARELPDLPDVQVQVGLLELRKGNRTAARAAFGRVLERRPEDFQALSSLVAMDLQDKDPDAARNRIEAAVDRGPENTGVLLLAGQTSIALGDNRAAEAYLTRCIEADPDFMEGYGTLASLYLRENRLAEAEAQLEHIFQEQRSVAAGTAVGVLMEMQHRTGEAQARYEAVLAIDRGAAVAANNLAWIYAEKGDDLEAALQLAQTAKASLPDRPEVNDTLGVIYIKKGLSTLAVGPLLAATNAAPKVGKYQYHLGMAYAAAGDTVKAKAALEKAFSLDANFQGADEARRMLATMK